MRGGERGFTYIEVLLSLIVLSFAVIGMGLALQQTRLTTEDAGGRRLPRYLIQDGVAWALTLARRDPTEPSSFGAESGESVANYDDVDDLNGLVESPPVDRSAEVFGAQWARSFTVESVDPDDPDQVVAAGSSNLMRLEVTVTRNGGSVETEKILLWRSP